MYIFSHCYPTAACHRAAFNSGKKTTFTRKSLSNMWSSWQVPRGPTYPTAHLSTLKLHL